MSATKAVLAQLARYLLVGGFAFIVDFTLFTLCFYALEWHYLLANLVGLIAGLSINYTLSVRWVFADCKRRLEKYKSKEFAVFALIGFAGVGINELLMLILVDIFNLPELISKTLAAIAVLIWNFAGRKLTLFKERIE